MFVVIAINPVQQHVVVVSKVGHVEKFVRKFCRVNNIDVNKSVMLVNVHHVRKRVFDHVNVEK